MRSFNLLRGKKKLFEFSNAYATELSSKEEKCWMNRALTTWLQRAAASAVYLNSAFLASHVGRYRFVGDHSSSIRNFFLGPACCVAYKPATVRSALPRWYVGDKCKLMETCSSCRQVLRGSWASKAWAFRRQQKAQQNPRLLVLSSRLFHWDIE